MKAVYYTIGMLLGATLIPLVSANTFETQMALERELFEYAFTGDEALVIEDPTEDFVVFDKKGRNDLPPVLADLTSMTITPGEEGWVVRFETVTPLPEDPGLAVNFDIFIDQDGDNGNNAPTGVFRSNSDTIFMILFGTRTKWHSKWWKYDTSLNRWLEQPAKPEYTIEEGAYSIVIPYDVIPRESGVPMRGFSLTSADGITALDIAPGTDFPPILTEQPVPPQPKQQPQKAPKKEEPAKATASATATTSLVQSLILYVVVFVLGVSLTLWWVKRK